MRERIGDLPRHERVGRPYHAFGQASLAALMAAWLLAAPLLGQECAAWSPAERIGVLPSQLRESSGLAASAAFPGRLYHVNDSGDAGAFYTTAMDGTGLRTIGIADFRPRDTEALSLGPCPSARDVRCLYIGDIGDNPRRRKTVEIVAVSEAAEYPATVKPAARLTLRYPDGPHDAESMAVHPDGTLLILTKERPSRLFKARLDRPEQTMELVTTLDAGGPPTDMALSADGRRLLVLTYLEAIQFDAAFTRPRKILLSFLQQQESIAYLPDGRSFVYSTERAMARLIQPIMRVSCRPSP